MKKYFVIIPCYNEAENLPRCLSSIEAARGGRSIGVRLADNGSSDQSTQIAERFGAEVVVSAERIAIAALRNMGADNADAEVLIFLDADMEVPVDWFDHLDRAFDVDGIDAVGFVESIPPAAPWYSAAWSMRTAARRDRPVEADFLPGRNIAVRRTAFEKVGGFSTQLFTSEDKDFILRLKKSGAKPYSYPQIGLYHWGFEQTAYELARKEFWRQGSHLAMLRRHGLKLRLLRFPALAVFHLVAWLLLPLAFVFAQPVWVLPWFISWLPSLVIVFMKPLSRRRPVLAAQLTLLYHLRFVLAGCSFLYEWISGRGATDYVRS